MALIKKTQSSLEYLIIIGVGLFILAAALSYSFYYTASYSAQQYSQQLGLAVTTISGTINSLISQGIGSTQKFTFTSPGLSLSSALCTNYISLSYQNQVASASLSLPTYGELPIDGGTYTGYIKLINRYGQAAADIRMDLPVSYVNSSYLITPSSVFYNLSFFDLSGQPVGDVNFTMIVMTPDHTVIAEQNETAISGEYSGSVPVPTYNPNALILVYMPTLGIVYPSCSSPSIESLIPKNINAYAPVTITNSQNTSTQAPFQQMVTVDSAKYAYLEASNLQNVEFFYANGSVIPSWLESGNSNSATSTVYWLKLGFGVQAGSSTTIYMGFVNKTTNLFNGNTIGEAPQLSSTYGQYDNGANVFTTFYQNFAGTSLPSGWTGSGYTINNGLSLPYSSYAITSTNYGLNSAQILDYYGNFPLATSSSNAGFGYTLSSSAVTSSSSIQTWFEINNGVWSNGYDGGLVDSGSSWSGTPALSTGYNVYSVYWPSSSKASFSVNYDTPSVLTTNVYGSQLPIGGANTQNSQATIGPFYWARVRAYPPNGIMPSVSIGVTVPSVTVFVNGVKNGDNGIAFGTETNITATSSPFAYIGLMVNGSVVVPIKSGQFSYTAQLNPGLYNITVITNNSYVKNTTYWEAVASLPAGVTNFLPIILKNNQTAATPAPFQQPISLNSFAFKKYENDSLSNLEFFSPHGTIIQSWLQSGNIPYFNGGSSHMDIPENTPISPAGTFSVSIWFKTTSDGIILWNGNNLPTSNPGGYSNILYVTTSGDLAGGDWTGSEPFVTNINVANGKWHNVVITQTSSEQVLYLDGTEVATHSGTPQSFSPYYWAVGYGYTEGWSGTPSNSVFYFNGYLSNLQMYNRILSPTNVAQLYDEGLGGSPLNNSGSIAWWLMSGNGNDYIGHYNMATSNIVFDGASSASTNTTYWLKFNSSIVSGIPYIAFEGFGTPSTVLLNGGSTGEAPQLSQTYGQYNNIANIMNPGLLYQFYQISGSGINPQNSVYQASISPNTVFSYGSLTATASSVLNKTSLTGSSQNVNGNTQNNVLINYQYSNSGGAAFPNPPITNPQYVIMKAVGFAQLNSPTTFYVLTDDGMGIGYNGSVTGMSPWLGGTSSSDNPNNLINSWISQGATQYSGTINTVGTFRLEIDYTNQGGPGYDGFWSNNAVNYYSPTYPTNGIVPTETIGYLNGVV